MHVSIATTMLLVCVSTISYADDSDGELFSVNTEKLVEVARDSIVEQYPSHTDCTAMTTVEISSESTTQLEGNLCVTNTTYKSLQVHTKGDGRTIIGGDISTPGTGTRSEVQECSESDSSSCVCES